MAMNVDESRENAPEWARWRGLLSMVRRLLTLLRGRHLQWQPIPRRPMVSLSLINVNPEREDGLADYAAIVSLNSRPIWHGELRGQPAEDSPSVLLRRALEAVEADPSRSGR